MSHEFYMNRALELSRQGLGRCAPNPSVGCVIVRDGTIIAEARTADGGRPHAERIALEAAGDAARGSDVYVTLEPCSHKGMTPSCASFLIQMGVKRVFFAAYDPDPRVNGQGAQMLRDAGVEVYEGLLQEQAEEVLAGFFLKIKGLRPWVSLKMAVSADDKIAGPFGQRVQISCGASMDHMHRALRATHDGIAIGAGTAIKDDPLLTTRVMGLPHAPFRFVFGGDMSNLSDLKIFQDQGGGRIIHMKSAPVDILLQKMAMEHGMTRILVEGGACLMQAFLDSGLWDALYLYRSPMIIGEGGIDAPDFSMLSAPEEVQEIDVDRLEIYANRS